MKIRGKILLTVIPPIVVGIMALGYWAMEDARRNIHASNYEFLTLVMNEFVNHHLERRVELLHSSGLDAVSKYVRSFQQEALDEITIVSKQTNRDIFIVDARGNPIPPTKLPDSMGTPDLGDLAKRALESADVIRGIVGEGRSGAFYVARAFKPWEWVVFVSTPEHTVTAFVDEIELTIFSAGFVIAIACGLLVFLVSSRTLIRPISTLQAAASSIARDEPIERILVKDGDELGSLARDMERMAESIDEKTAALKGSEERFRNAFETTAHGFALVSPEGRYLKVNRALCDIVGYSEEELLATDFPLITHPEDRERDFEAVRRLIAGEIRSYQVEKRYIHRQGHSVWILLSTALVRDSEGKPLYFVSQMQDITARRRAEEALRESEDRFRRLFEKAPLGYQSLDEDGRFIEVNQAWLDMLGYSREQVIGRWFGDFVAERDFFDETFPRFKEVGEIQVPGYEMLCKNGSIKIVAFAGRIGYDEQGNFLQTHCILIDITERKRAESKLLESDNRLKEAARIANLGYWIWDEVNDKIIDCSDEFARIYGTTKEHMLAMSEDHGELDPVYIHPDDHDRVAKEYNKFRARCEIYDIEFRIAQPDGTLRNIREFGKPIFDEKGQLVRSFGFIQDITEHKRLEHQFVQAQKMEAVGQLTGGIAHDFNNMLGVIMGNLDLLRRKVAGDPKAMEYIEAAYEGSKRGARITAKLLDFSRKEVGKLQLIIVNKFIRGMENLIAKSLTAKITVETHLADDIWTVNIDPRDFEDTLLNFSLNARDAMPDGGFLVIESANKILDEQYVQHNPGSTAGEHVMVSVSDTGTGMTPDVVDKVFQPFFSTKDEGQGTGLGLSMVYGFVQRSGGHIKVYSEPGKGTTFRIFLPRAIEETDGIEAANAVADGEPQGGDETVLVVDDEKRLLKVAVSFLENLGYRTLTAVNGKQALEILQEQKQIDLLFSDVVMPGGMDGYDLAKEVMESYPGLKMLLTSGFQSKRENNVNGDKPLLEKLSNNLLRKPYNQPELAAAVRRALDEED